MIAKRDAAKATKDRDARIHLSHCHAAVSRFAFMLAKIRNPNAASTMTEALKTWVRSVNRPSLSHLGMSLKGALAAGTAMMAVLMTPSDTTTARASSR